MRKSKFYIFLIVIQLIFINGIMFETISQAKNYSGIEAYSTNFTDLMESGNSINEGFKYYTVCYKKLEPGKYYVIGNVNVSSASRKITTIESRIVKQGEDNTKFYSSVTASQALLPIYAYFEITEETNILLQVYIGDHNPDSKVYYRELNVLKLK